MSDTGKIEMTVPSILFLDDELGRVKDFEARTGLRVTWVMTGEDFCAQLNHSHFDVIMLDHDLGLPDFDGSDAAKYLAANRLLLGDDQTVVIHSANPVGVANMMSRMKHADHLRVSVVHFGWSKARMLDGVLTFSI